MSFWIEMAIHAVLGFVTSTIKNPTSKGQYQTILLQIRDAINELYPN